MTITPKRYNKEQLDNVLLIYHVFKDFFQKWSWWKLSYILNWNKWTWKTGFTFQQNKVFNGAVFQHFVDELKHCNHDMWMDIQLVAIFFVFIFNIFGCYVTLKNDLFFIICFGLFSFLVSLKYFSPLLQDVFVILNEQFSQ